MRIAYGPAPTNPEAWLHGVLTSSTFWTAMAAIASAGALIFIARQTRATRDAAQATRDAAEAGQATVLATQKQAEIAAQALETSQAALKQSQWLAEQEVKGRIDAEMPRLRLDAPTSVDWPPREPSVTPNGDPQEFSVGEVFYLSKDAARRIIVRTPILLANDSDAPVKVDIHAPLGGLYRNKPDEKRDPPSTQLFLSPRQSREDMYFEVERTVGEWAEIYRTRASGAGPGSFYELIVLYTSTSDTGAVDRYKIVVQGTVLEPVPGIDAAWRIRQTAEGTAYDSAASIAAVPQPMTREYWLSRIKNLRLDLSIGPAA